MQKTEIRQYQWLPRLSGPMAHSDVNLVVAELEVIRETRGEITPELIVESAANKKSQLHKYFQWDNDKAAHSFRLSQASYLLRNIQVKVIKDDKEILIRAYEITERKYIGTDSDSANKVSYNAYDPENEKQKQFVIKAAVIDLQRIKNKLQVFGHQKAADYIYKAVLELEKPSERKELVAVLERNEADSRSLQGTG